MNGGESPERFARAPRALDRCAFATRSKTSVSAVAVGRCRKSRAMCRTVGDGVPGSSAGVDSGAPPASGNVCEARGRSAMAPRRSGGRIAREPPEPDSRAFGSGFASISESFVAPSFFGFDAGIAARLRMSDDDAGMTRVGSRRDTCVFRGDRARHSPPHRARGLGRVECRKSARVGVFVGVFHAPLWGVFRGEKKRFFFPVVTQRAKPTPTPSRKGTSATPRPCSSSPRTSATSGGCSRAPPPRRGPSPSARASRRRPPAPP